jgi:hypothetical protein
MFAQVLRAAFTGTHRNSDFLVPALDLTACFPDAAAQFILQRGGRAGVAVRDRGTGCRRAAHGAEVANLPPPSRRRGRSSWRPSTRPQATMAGAGRSATSAFACGRSTIYLGFAGRIAFGVPMLRLDDAPGHWAFDRSTALGSGAGGGTQSLIAVVISAGGPHDALDHGTLASKVEVQLRRLAPDLPRHSACSPNGAPPTPAPGLAPWRRTRRQERLSCRRPPTRLPATLEAATQRRAAAHALIADGAAARCSRFLALHDARALVVLLARRA